jgi:hypothetical protein
MTTPFPNNVVETLQQRLGTIDILTRINADDLNPTGIPACFTRPLRPSDPAVCVGVFPLDWAADEQEIGGTEPTLSTYVYAVQSFVKHTDEQEGNLLHGLLSKTVRAMLYRDQPTRVALGTLSETSLGITERAQRWGVRQQRFANNEVDGQFLYLSTTDFWLQTESL